MARVNVDILGIRELKWTGMGEFKSDDHYIYCVLPSSWAETKALGPSGGIGCPESL